MHEQASPCFTTTFSLQFVQLLDAEFADLDECANPAAFGCGENQTCVNSIGSYTCNCKPGYKLDPGSGKCLGATRVHFTLFLPFFLHVG